MLHLSEGIVPWSPISFSISWCWSRWCGCASCCIGCGPALPLLYGRRHRSPQAHGPSARMSPPFAGLTTTPRCDACEHATAPHPHAPSAPPPRLVPPRGRRRQGATSRHCGPNPDWAYRGWVGWGNLRATGHPTGGPWRQLRCGVCRRDLLETRGTRLHGTRAAVDLIVHVRACLAEDFLPFVTPNVSNLTSSARLAHGDFGRHHSRCAHATSRSGDAAAGLQCCGKLGRAAGLWPAESPPRRRNGPHVAWRLAPGETGHGASAGYTRAASRLVGACHCAWCPGRPRPAGAPPEHPLRSGAGRLRHTTRR